MIFRKTTPLQPQQTRPEACETTRAEFSGYLDGAISGVAMATIASHLEACDDCAQEFEALRTVQQSLSSLGHATAPDRLQAQLHQAIALERERGTHLSLRGKFLLAWDDWLASAALRASAGLAAAIVFLGGFAWMFGAPLAVQANDDNMSHLIAPHFLYAEVPPQPVTLDRDTLIMVEAKVDTTGRVYDYSILSGPTDPSARLRVEQNLLASIFKPATLFGAPVRGHVVLTYTGISVRG
jgi:hypothetical protein